MTNQEMFDKVCRHLLTQKEKSVNYYGICMYRFNWNYDIVMGVV